MVTGFVAKLAKIFEVNGEFFTSSAGVVFDNVESVPHRVGEFVVLLSTTRAKRVLFGSRLSTKRNGAKPPFRFVGVSLE